MRGGDEEGQNKMQLIDERGEFDEHACESFLHDAANAHEWNKKYAVMSIMGPQSSGKSTLMNHAFGTSFREMDELSGYVSLSLYHSVCFDFLLNAVLRMLVMILC